MIPCQNCRYKKTLQGGVRACNNLPQSNPYILVFGGCGRLLHALTPPRSAFLYLQFLARCHPYILLHFYTCTKISSVGKWFLDHTSSMSLTLRSICSDRFTVYPSSSTTHCCHFNSVFSGWRQSSENSLQYTTS